MLVVDGLEAQGHVVLVPAVGTFALALYDEALSGLDHIVGSHLHPRRVHLTVGTLAAVVGVDHPVGGAVGKGFHLTDLHVEGQRDERPHLRVYPELYADSVGLHRGVVDQRTVVQRPVTFPALHIRIHVQRETRQLQTAIAIDGQDAVLRIVVVKELAVDG